MSFIKNYSTNNRWAIMIMIFFIGVISTIVFFSIDKGFDLADEGLHLALSNPKVSNNNSLFNYDLIFKILYKFLGFEFDILTLRLAKYLSLASVFLFGLSFFRKYNFSTLDKCFLALAVFSSYTYLTLSLSYNTLCFLIVILYVFIYVKINNGFTFKQNLLWIALAVLSSLCFLVKPPISLILLGLTFLFSVISSPRVSWKYLLIRFLFISIGYIIIQIFFQIIFPNYSHPKVLGNGVEISSYGSYSKSILVKRILVSFKWVFILNIAGWFLSYLFTQKKFNLIKSLVSITIIFITIFYFFISHLSSNEFNVFQYGLMILSCIGIGGFMYFQRLSQCTWSNIVVMILLFIAPFICSFGSNVYYFRTGQQYVFFWILLMVYIKNINNRIPNQFVLIWYFIFASFITFKIYNNIIVVPENQPKLTSCNFKYEYADNKFILLEKNQANYIKNLKKKLELWSPNSNEIIGLYAMPGDILLTGYRNYYNPLIWDNSQWNFFKSKLNNDAEYKRIPMPMLISKDLDANKRRQLNNYKQVDSVEYYKGGYVYLFIPN